MAITAALLIFLIFLGISRVYLGAHSYNEVVFGTSLGLVVAFILHFFMKPALKRLYKESKNPANNILNAH
jgi:membrane-associated phospholipid phosphatase